MLCEGYRRIDKTSSELEPADTNFRHFAQKIHEDTKDHDSWFALEQEYTLFDGFHELHRWPLGWPKDGFPPPQGKYYCGNGYPKAPGRAITEAHMKACLHAGLDFGGINVEVMPGSFEYQIGPSNILDLGDHTWVSRFLLERIAEDFEVMVDFHPKPIRKGDWNGAGAHLNFSTKEMRAEGGMKHIETAIHKLMGRHHEHIEMYGEGNEMRLTGAHETCSIEEFKWGVADRGCSIRVPFSTFKDQKGFLEDRRPASNVDPYIGAGAIAATTL